jgi:hypothetical protein
MLATRYVTPLREGGSLPALVEAEDDGLYVLKFRGAGQGPKALVAELVVGELGRRIGLRVPELVLLDVDPDLGRAEPDPEIQDLLDASRGVNLGLDFLPGALAFDPAATPEVDPGEAAAVVWLDALTTNVDRTPRNPNLLVWHGRLWLIDHGAAFYRHHQDWRLESAAAAPFPVIAEHVLLPYAGSVATAHERLAPQLTGPVVAEVLAAVPDAWLADEADATPAQRRAAYADHLAARIADGSFAREADDARA